MLNDISVVMDSKDEDLDQLVCDLISLNFDIVDIDNVEDDDPSLNMLIYRFNLSDEELNKLLTFVKASPYGDGYEIERWNTGNCEILWD